MKKLHYLFSTLALSGLITACGGGGGGSAAEPTKPLNPQYENKKQTVNKDNKSQGVSPSGKIEKNPVVAGEKLAVAEEKPAVAEEKPAVVEEKPAVVEAKPVMAEVKPILAEEKPAMAEEQPEKWGGIFPHSKDKVPVYKLIENDHSGGDDEPNFKAQEKIEIALKNGFNDHPDYRFYVMDDNVYYGFYRNSENMKEVINNFGYSFKDDDENKGDLSQLTANYKGQFWYATRATPTVVTHTDLSLEYKQGQAKGEIVDHGGKLFDVRSTTPRTLELTPAIEEPLGTFGHDRLSKGADRMEIPVHFINGSDGIENKHIVGQGKSEKYWGVLGATKQ